MSFDGDISIPLISLSGALGSDVEINFPVLVISGTLGMSGELSLPLVRIIGKTQDIINGEIRLHCCNFAGEIGVAAKITADVVLPLLAVVGNMQADCEIQLHALRITGFMQKQGSIEGSILFPKLAIAGFVQVTTWIVGEVAIPVLQFFGNIVKPNVVLSGDVEIPCINFFGTITSSASYDFAEETDLPLNYSSNRKYL